MNPVFKKTITGLLGTASSGLLLAAQLSSASQALPTHKI